jgi:protein SCO1/2
MAQRRPQTVAIASLIAGTLIAFSGFVWWFMSQDDQAAAPASPRVELPAVGGPFSLTSHEGRVVTDADLRGKLLLISFGYSYCPDVCPTILLAVSQTMAALGDDAEQVQPLFITIDPERDDVETLANYVPNFHPELIGLTGSPEEIAGVVKAYRVYRAKVETEDVEGYLMDHSTLIYLMDREGALATMFSHGTAPEDMASTIREHL